MSAQAEHVGTVAKHESTRRRPAIVAVDDEPAVLAAVARDLRAASASASACCGRRRGPRRSELLRELRARGDEVAMLIADQRMPGMPGTEYLRSGAPDRPGRPSACC